MYIVAQMLGSALASGIVYGTRPSTTSTLGLNAVSKKVHITVVGRIYENMSSNLKFLTSCTSKKCDPLQCDKGVCIKRICVNCLTELKMRIW